MISVTQASHKPSLGFTVIGRSERMIYNLLIVNDVSFKKEVHVGLKALIHCLRRII